MKPPGVTSRAAFEDYDVYAILEDVSGVLNLEPVSGGRQR